DAQLDRRKCIPAVYPEYSVRAAVCGPGKRLFRRRRVQRQLRVWRRAERPGIDRPGQRHFGIISGEQVIQARANDRPVVFVYEGYQKYPIGIATPLDSGITSVADLKGRKVGIPGRFGASYTGLTAVLAANDMTESDIDLQEIGFNAADVVCVGGVDAAVVYINNEPLQIDDRAKAGNCGTVTGVKVFS